LEAEFLRKTIVDTEPSTTFKLSGKLMNSSSEIEFEFSIFMKPGEIEFLLIDLLLASGF